MSTKPGTELPWRLSRSGAVVAGEEWQEEQIAFNGRGGNDREWISVRDKDLAYIVHACNNYAALEAKLERFERVLTLVSRAIGYGLKSQPDHACKECMDERGYQKDSVTEGFQCWRHSVTALTASTTENGG